MWAPEGYVAALGLQVWIVHPGFFFGQVPCPFEVEAGAQLREPESEQLVGHRFDRCARGGLIGALHDESFIDYLTSIPTRRAIDVDCSIEGAVAGIHPLDLVPFD